MVGKQDAYYKWLEKKDIFLKWLVNKMLIINGWKKKIFF